MTMDRRYPWMESLERRSLTKCTADETEKVRRIAEAVCKRTGVQACWNSRFGKIHFYTNGDIAKSAWAFDFKTHGECGGRPVTEADIDDMCDMVRAGRISPEEKDAIRERQEAQGKSDERSSRERFVAGEEKEILKDLDRIRKRKRGLTTIMG